MGWDLASSEETSQELHSKALAMGAEECICKRIDMERIETTLKHHQLL